MHAYPRRSPARAWTVAWMDVFVVGVLILALLGTWSFSRQVEQRVEDEGVHSIRIHAEGLAQLMAEQWQQTAQRIELLHYLAGQARPTPTETGANVWGAPADLQKAIALSSEGVKQVGAIDPHGRLMWSTDPVPPGIIDLSDREHYRAIAIDGRDRFTGRPVRGRVTGRLSMQFAAAHRDENGALTCITVVSLDLAGTRVMAEKAGILHTGEVMLVRDDGVMLSRSFDTRASLKRVVPAAMLAPVLEHGRSDIIAPGPIDGVPRFYSLRRIVGSDMILIVGLNEAEAMAPVIAATGQIRQWAVALGLALVAMAFVVNAVCRRSRSLSRERQRSNELYERQALLREIAESASDIIIILDDDLVPLFVSPAIEPILGYAPEAMRGLPLGSRLMPDDRERVRTGVQALRAAGGSWRGTYRMRHADGSIRWLESEIVAIADPDGPDGARFVAICRDVTRRIDDEAALRTVKAELNALVRLGPGAFYRMALTTGQSAEEARWFPAGFPLLGLWPGEVDVGSRFLQRVHPADRPLLNEAIERCRVTGDATAEYRLQGPGQELAWVRDRMRLVTGTPTETVVFGYLTEITQEREDMSRLRQVERLATLGEVAAGVAHEMNQPLAAIAMAAENGQRLMRQGRPPEQVMAKLGRILEHAHRLSRITDAVCLFGRADGNTAWDATFQEVMANVRVLVKPRLVANDVTLQVNAEGDLPRIKASPVVLEQALMNLIANACDAYAARGASGDGAVVRISAAAEGDQVRITVADQAGGVPVEIIDRIFDPFFTTKEPGRGTGLGLSVTYARITEMGGRIGVRNRDGGAWFDLCLPVLTALRQPEAVS